jgi:hypothetical protein
VKQSPFVLRTLVGLTIATLLAVGLATPAPARAVKFVRHSGHFWVWFGPSSDLLVRRDVEQVGGELLGSDEIGLAQQRIRYREAICHCPSARNQYAAKYAPATRWNTMKATLSKVQKSLAYSGPGVQRGPGENPVDP